MKPAASDGSEFGDESVRLHVHIGHDARVLCGQGQRILRRVGAQVSGQVQGSRRRSRKLLRTKVR